MASGYLFRVTYRSLSDVSYSDECLTKNAFKHVKRMSQLFRAVVKSYRSLLEFVGIARATSMFHELLDLCRPFL